MITRAHIRRQLRKNGGIMNVTPRQGYFLGKIVKGVGKAVGKVADVAKEVVKSPVGKAALLGLGGAGLMGAGPLGTMLGGVGSKMGLTGLGGRISPFLFGAQGIGGPAHGASKGILGKLGLTKGWGSKMPTVLGGITAAGLMTYFMQKGKTEEEAEQLAQDVYRGKGLGLDLIKADIKKYRTGDLSGSQMFDKGYHFLTPRNYIGAAGGRVGLKGGGADWINTHKPGPMGNPAVMEKIENMREWRIANPDVEDVADYKSYYEKLKKKKKKKEKKAEGGRIGLYAGGNGTPLPEDPTKPINPWAPRPKEGIKSLEAGASSIKVEGDVRPENMKMARRLNVDNMNRRTLVKHLNNMELPETNASDFDDNHIRQILIDFAPDMFFGSWGSNMAEGGRIGYAEGTNSMTSKIPELWEADLGGGPMEGIVKMGMTVRAPFIDVVRMIYGTGKKATEIIGKAAELGWDVTKPVREAIGYTAKKGLEGTKWALGHSDKFRYGTKNYWALRATGMSDDEARLFLQDSKVGEFRKDPELIKKLESRLMDEKVGESPDVISMSEVSLYPEREKTKRISQMVGTGPNGLPRIPMGMPRVNAGGIRELDYRQSGGFVPMGVKEKADDVPAMLSKNEFVMTADAVRGAGGGSVEKGAQRMYDTMKRLEGKIA